MNIIELEDVSLIYRTPASPTGTLKEWVIRKATFQHATKLHHALSNVSFAVPAGMSLGVVGNNGAGKSSLLKLIAQVLYPTKGRICVRGDVAAMLELGAGLHPELTGIENIYLSAAILGKSRAEIQASVARIIEFADIGDFIHVPLRMYSTGMMARLAFAVMTAWSSRVLLIDEIMSVGDFSFQARCKQRLSELQKAATSLVVVSHDLGVIREYCSHAIWLQHGKVMRAGLAADVLKDYSESSATKGALVM